MRKQTRTGTDALAIAGAIFEHDMEKGFPLLTTKKVPFKMVASELEFFINGITDKKWLLDRNNHIWDEWAWKHHNMWAKENAPQEVMTQEEVIKKLTDLPADDPFVIKWGDLIKNLH